MTKDVPVKIEFLSNIPITGCGPTIDGVDLAFCNAEDQQNIPTHSEWGVLLLGISLSIFGVIGIRQRELSTALL